MLDLGVGTNPRSFQEQRRVPIVLNFVVFASHSSSSLMSPKDAFGASSTTLRTIYMTNCEDVYRFRPTGIFSSSFILSGSPTRTSVGILTLYHHQAVVKERICRLGEWLISWLIAFDNCEEHSGGHVGAELLVQPNAFLCSIDNMLLLHVDRSRAADASLQLKTWVTRPSF